MLYGHLSSKKATVNSTWCQLAQCGILHYIMIHNSRLLQQGKFIHFNILITYSFGEKNKMV